MKESGRLGIGVCAAVACMICLGSGWAAETTVCQYGPGKSELAGTLIQKVFYGPPGYGEDPKHDRKERVFVLRLSGPVSVRPAAGKEAGQESHDNVREMQVDDLAKVRLKDFINKKVRIRGILRTAEIGHDHTEGLITPEEIIPNEGRHGGK